MSEVPATSSLPTPWTVVQRGVDEQIALDAVGVTTRGALHHHGGLGEPVQAPSTVTEGHHIGGRIDGRGGGGGGGCGSGGGSSSGSGWAFVVVWLLWSSSSDQHWSAGLRPGPCSCTTVTATATTTGTAPHHLYDQFIEIVDRKQVVVGASDVR